jgi:dihydrofolate reductase
MGKVRTGLAVSLDGFISGPNDGAEAPMGDGGERLVAWYGGGDTDYRLPGTDMVFRVSAQTAEFLRETRETTGALVFGRRTFDLTHGWGGNHPLDVPVFVVTGSVPPEWVLRRIAVHVRHRRTRERPSASESGCRRQGRRRGRREHHAAVHPSGTPRRDPHRPGARLALGWRPLVRPPRHRAD